MSEIVTQQQNLSVFLGEDAFKSAQRMAQLLAAATQGVPREYQNNLPNCVVALEMAYRLQVSPLMVMQNVDIIHGKPAPKSTFIIALINSSGKFSDDLDFEYSGSGDDRACYAYTKRKDGKLIKGPEVSIRMAKAEGWYGKNGSKWPNMPDVMLSYRAAAFFSRIYCPNITMGMQSADEVEDVGYVESSQNSDVIQEINAIVDQKNQERYVQYEDIEVNEPETVTTAPPPPPSNEDF